MTDFLQKTWKTKISEVSSLCFLNGFRKNKHKGFLNIKNKETKITKQRRIVWKPLLFKRAFEHVNKRKQERIKIKSKEKKRSKRKKEKEKEIILSFWGFSFARPLPPNAPQNLEYKRVLYVSSGLFVGLVGLRQQNPKHPPPTKKSNPKTETKNIKEGLGWCWALQAPHRSKPSKAQTKPNKTRTKTNITIHKIDKTNTDHKKTKDTPPRTKDRNNTKNERRGKWNKTSTKTPCRLKGRRRWSKVNTKSDLWSASPCFVHKMCWPLICPQNYFLKETIMQIKGQHMQINGQHPFLFQKMTQIKGQHILESGDLWSTAMRHVLISAEPCISAKTCRSMLNICRSKVTTLGETEKSRLIP